MVDYSPPPAQSSAAPTSLFPPRALAFSPFFFSCFFPLRIPRSNLIFSRLPVFILSGELFSGPPVSVYYSHSRLRGGKEKQEEKNFTHLGREKLRESLDCRLAFLSPFHHHLILIITTLSASPQLLLLLLLSSPLLPFSPLRTHLPILAHRHRCRRRRGPSRPRCPLSSTHRRQLSYHHHRRRPQQRLLIVCLCRLFSFSSVSRSSSPNSSQTGREPHPATTHRPGHRRIPTVVDEKIS